ncbi:YwmB family TATA-box binding protein [Bacillus sp. FSL K6-3431]|uniref:YwmB family TATA-box binding protein n=1 Tax=Bacillus sp. FSL K6-3431 TaxID=2921500 RepID=UPI0030FAC8DC
MNKKQALVIIHIIVTICFVTIFIGNNISAAQKSMDIQVLADKIESQNGTIVEWSLYARELVHLSNEDKRLEKIQWLKKQFPNMEWHTGMESSSDIVVGKRQFEYYSEIIKLISTDKNRQSSSYIVYEVRGKSWDRDQNAVESLSKYVSTTIKLLFDKKPVIFSCIKGEFNKRFDEFKYQSLQDLIKSLHAEEVKTLKERDFYSISAKSSLLDETISFTDTEMNMQIGLRNNGSESSTTIVIGTPILTIEY